MKDAVQQQEMFVIEILLSDSTKRYRRMGQQSWNRWGKNIQVCSILNKGTKTRYLKEAEKFVANKEVFFEDGEGEDWPHVIGARALRVGLVLEDM